jgi:hypothetical protein
MQENITQVIIDCCRQVEEAFNPNELAYLCVTGLAENQFRDKLTFLLHERLIGYEFHVVREYHYNQKVKRVDIAILDKEIPRALIELKAYYVSDILLHPKHRYLDMRLTGMRKDAEKIGNVQTEMVEKILILLAPYVANLAKLTKENSGRLLKKHRGVVKYYYILEKPMNPTKEIPDCNQIVQRELSQEFSGFRSEYNIKLITFKDISCGICDEMEIRLLFWIFAVDKSR